MHGATSSCLFLCVCGGQRKPPRKRLPSVVLTRLVWAAGIRDICPATDQLAIDILVVATWTLVVARVVFLSYSYPWLVHSVVHSVVVFSFLGLETSARLGDKVNHNNQPSPAWQRWYSPTTTTDHVCCCHSLLFVWLSRERLIHHQVDISLDAIPVPPFSSSHCMRSCSLLGRAWAWVVSKLVEYLTKAAMMFFFNSCLI